jgi:3-phosphoglycerate kinase
MDGRGIGVRFPAGTEDSFLLHSSHATFYVMGTGDSFAGIKAAGAQVKETWSYISTLP